MMDMISTLNSDKDEHLVAMAYKHMECRTSSQGFIQWELQLGSFFSHIYIYVPKGNAMYLPDFHVNITTTCTGGFEIFYLIDVQKG